MSGMNYVFTYTRTHKVFDFSYYYVKNNKFSNHTATCFGRSHLPKHIKYSKGVMPVSRYP